LLAEQAFCPYTEAIYLGCGGPRNNYQLNKRQFGSLALIAISVLAAGCARNPQAINNSVRAAGIAKAERIPRKVYRYSVIPGGVYSIEELARARRVDSTVGAHYADFGSRVQVQISSGPALLYVSYRKGDRVYWTAKKHRIPKGEALLTDGKHLARTRCGNRLSLSPQLPTLTIDEPNENQLAGIQPPENPLADMPLAPLISPGLDVPEFPGDGGPPSGPFPLARSGAGDAGRPALTSPFLTPMYTPLGLGFLIGPGFGIKPPTGTTGGGPPPGTGGGTTTGGGGTNIPEPTTVIFLLLGVSVLLLIPPQLKR